MRYYGISVYPNLFTEKECISYLNLAKKYNFKRVFTNFIEISKKSEIDKFFKICQHAKNLGFEIIIDINPNVFKELNFNLDTGLKFFSEMGASGLRIDEEFDGEYEALISHNKYGLKLELNASSTTNILEKIIAKGGNIKNIIACHNFYPQRYSGLSEKLFSQKRDYYNRYNILLAAFISSNNKKAKGPWLITEGLPTLETHRTMQLVDQAKDFIASDLVDDIIISNQPATEAEFKKLARLANTGFNFNISLSKNISEIEKKVLFDEKIIYYQKELTHTIRSDYSDWIIRSSASRIKFAKQRIKPRKIKRKYFEVGEILVLNKLYDRYNGEVQIVLKKIDYDPRKNLVAKISKSDLNLLKYLKPGMKINFIK